LCSHENWTCITSTTFSTLSLPWDHLKQSTMDSWAAKMLGVVLNPSERSHSMHMSFVKSCMLECITLGIPSLLVEVTMHDRSYISQPNQSLRLEHLFFPFASWFFPLARVRIMVWLFPNNIWPSRWRQRLIINPAMILSPSSLVIATLTTRKGRCPVKTKTKNSRGVAPVWDTWSVVRGRTAKWPSNFPGGFFSLDYVRSRMFRRCAVKVKWPHALNWQMVGGWRYYGVEVYIHPPW
jgi:hypothetical protein